MSRPLADPLTKLPGESELDYAIRVQAWMAEECDLSTDYGRLGPSDWLLEECLIRIEMIKSGKVEEALR